MDEWLLLQLADSAFPVGGFAHSAGLEAAHQLGEAEGAAGLDAFVSASVWQAGFGSLPLVGAAHDDPSRFVELDALADAFLSGAVANRASRAQGRAFALAASRVFDDEGVVALAGLVSRREAAAHFAPLFGAIARVLGVPRRETARLSLHLAYRTVSSAAVRLGLAGPFEAQRNQRRHGALLEAVLTTCGDLPLEALGQPAPLIDLYSSFQDSFYSRLFQS